MSNTKSRWVILENKESFDKVFLRCIDLYGLPIISNELVIYSDKTSNRFEIRLTPKTLHLSIKGKNHYDDFVTKYAISIPPNNTYTLCKLLHQLSPDNKYDILNASKFLFRVNESTDIFLSEETLPGRLLQLKTDNQHFNINEIEESLNISFLEINDEPKNIPHREFDQILIDQLGVINSKISVFCKNNGIIFSNHRTYENILEVKLNDYSTYERPFKQIFNNDLLSFNNISNYHTIDKPISIIIPNFNSDDTLQQTLFSINSQKTFIRDIKVEVIVVDDGSSKDIPRDIIDHKYNYPLKFVKINENQGLSVARNTGAAVSSGYILVFIDSDILLPCNYLLEMTARAITIPNAVFISMKKNIDKNTPGFGSEDILKGLMPPKNYDDKRIYRYLASDYPTDETPSKNYVELLSESDYLKTFGNMSTMGTKEFELQSMVIGHNIVLSKDIFLKTGGFPSNIKGWGLEDTIFGVKVVANGNFVIPVLSTGVYHINHPPRSGSLEKQKQEFTLNYNKYKNFLKQTIE